MALSPSTSHTVHRWNSLRVLGGSRGRVSSMGGHALPGRLPELSNFYCLPGRAGGSPLDISFPCLTPFPKNLGFSKKTLKIIGIVVMHLDAFSELSAAYAVGGPEMRNGQKTSLSRHYRRP